MLFKSVYKSKCGSEKEALASSESARGKCPIKAKVKSLATKRDSLSIFIAAKESTFDTNELVLKASSRVADNIHVVS